MSDRWNAKKLRKAAEAKWARGERPDRPAAPAAISRVARRAAKSIAGELLCRLPGLPWTRCAGCSPGTGDIQP